MEFDVYEASNKTTEEAKAVVFTINREAHRHKSFLSFLGLTEMAYQYATRPTQQAKTLILAIELIDGVSNAESVLKVMEAFERQCLSQLGVPPDRIAAGSSKTLYPIREAVRRLE